MKRRICGSSSTTSTSGGWPCGSSVGIVIGVALGRGGRRARQRQRETERDSAAGAVLGRDAPAVRVHDRAADGQPQAEPAALARRRLEELLEHLLLLAGRKARPVVGHLELDGLAGGA